ncbi:MAG TPA: beta-N-acetylhexosaminidase [Terriglobales bacterium]|nr:beta-N-acetylhexosaminidase [Terriglobales bacterium]
MKRSQLDLRQQVAQLIIMGVEGPELDGENVKTLTRLQPGGLILFARNITSAGQCYDLLRVGRRSTAVPMFTCVDLEGGMVDRFRELIGPAPSQAMVASTGSKAIFRKHGEVLGDEARSMGFNTDFAPVSDLAYESSKKVMGSRTASADPEGTIVYVREFLKGLNASGVIGCGKHFPGLGEADLDTHFSLPEIARPLKDLWKHDLLPYRKLHRQFPFVMVAHCAYPAVTGDRKPASLSSKWMKDVLRKKIGYRGIVLADDLEMGGVLAVGTIQDAALECIRAGADMFLVCRKEEFVIATFEAVLHEAERNSKFAKLVREACTRVIAEKKKQKGLTKVAARPTEKTIARLRQQLDTFKKQLEKAGATA